MRIGIDARFLTHPQPGGFKTYTENLVKALSLIDSANTYVLYLDRPPAEGALPEGNNFTYRVVADTLPVLGMPIREQIGLRRCIVQDSIDVMHFPCNTALLKPSGKFVVTLHDIIQLTNPQNFDYTKGLPAYKRWAISAYSRWVILGTVQLANGVITVSGYEKTQIINHLNIAPQRVSVTYLAPNPIFVPASYKTKNEWRSKVSQEWGIRGQFVLAVGYEPRKNIPLVIEAFSRFASTYPDISLVVVAAEKQSRLFFQQLASEWNVSERVMILEAISPNDLAVLYNLAEVFVFPSERESFGLPPLEALACGTPVIAMNMTSIPEILQNGAMLIEGKVVQTWANAIVQVITDDDLRSSLVSRGIKQASKFSWRQCAEETLQVYRTLQD